MRTKTCCVHVSLLEWMTSQNHSQTIHGCQRCSLLSSLRVKRRLAQVVGSECGFDSRCPLIFVSSRFVRVWRLAYVCGAMLRFCVLHGLLLRACVFSRVLDRTH